MTTKLTVLFEDPFWIGLFEKYEDGKLRVARVVFGSEPTDLEVYRFILEKGDRVRYGDPTPADKKLFRDIRDISPKRLQKMAAKELKNRNRLNKSFEVVRLDMEKNKTERKRESRKEREAEEKRKFEIRQARKKEKHRGH